MDRPSGPDDPTDREASTRPRRDGDGEDTVPAVTLVCGDDRHVVDPTDAPRRTVTDSFLCASGERWTGAWCGVAVEWLLERAPGGETATHLRIHGAGEHVACVSLADAFGGILAMRRGDDRLPAADRPRFVAPGVVAARTVKAVRRLELIELAPDEDADAHETFADGDDSSD